MVVIGDRGRFGGMRGPQGGEGLGEHGGGGGGGGGLAFGGIEASGVRER